MIFVTSYEVQANLCWIDNLVDAVHMFYAQEAKATAAFKAQNEKLQQERDEFQRMVIGNQVRTLFFIMKSLFLVFIRASY